MRDDLNLALSLLADLNDFTEVAYSAIDFDLVVKELLKGGNIEDLIRGGLRSIDNVLHITGVSNSG